MKKMLGLLLAAAILAGSQGIVYAHGDSSSNTQNGNMMDGQKGTMMNQGKSNMMQNRNGNMMNKQGSGMMGKYMKNNNAKIINQKTLDKLRKVSSDKYIIINKKTNTIEYTDTNITIPLIASPFEGKMYAFGVGGLVNPAIIVHKKSLVKIVFVNADDDMYHGIAITNTPPPYPCMVMKSVQLALTGSFIRPIAPEEKGRYIEAESQFRVSNPGTYYYICQVPGHAEKGMYGRLIIK